MINNKFSTIPTVIVHRSDQPYLKHCLDINSRKNEVILIGDSSISKYSKLNSKVHFVNINKYETNKSIIMYKKFFKNYSTNDFEFEWRCFERIFIIQKFMEELNLTKVFHIDSDSVLLVDVNKLKFEKECGYLTPKIQKNFRMDSSIHFSLLNPDFCMQFQKLYEEVYITESKFNLIKEKINFFKLHNLKGGICDMTFYYLLKKEKYLDPQNFMKEIKDFNQQDLIFLNNINLGEGYYGKKNYKMRGKYIKTSSNVVEDIIQNKKIKLAGIHYQGVAKKKLNWLLKYKLT